MTGLTTVAGIILLILAGIFIPHAALCLLAGIVFGEGWWVLFIPLAIIGVIVDLIRRFYRSCCLH